MAVEFERTGFSVDTFLPDDPDLRRRVEQLRESLRLAVKARHVKGGAAHDPEAAARIVRELMRLAEETVEDDDE